MSRFRLFGLLDLGLAETSPRQQRRVWLLVWFCGLGLLAGVTALSWSGQPYWMDADEYALFLGIGRWAVHPPGYLLFMALGRLLYAVGWASPYLTLQVLTLALTFVGLLLLYRLLRLAVAPLQASILVFTFALSWVPLLINHTGTSCTSDFFTVPLLLLTAVRLSERPSRAAAAWFSAALILCGGFRLATLIMMGPLLGVVLWRGRRHPWVWVAFAAAAAAVASLQALTIHAWGGWDMYRFMVWKENFVNRTYVESGAARILLNLGRTLLWFALATVGLWFALPRFGARRQWPPTQRTLVLFGALSTLGPFAVCAAYLCEHPGYVAPALAGFYLCVAVAWSQSDGRPGFGKWPVIAVASSLMLFFGMRHYPNPTSPSQATANGILLQYSAKAARDAYFLGTADWLRLSNELRSVP